MLTVKKIDGLTRVVERNTGKLASNLIFESDEDAWAYIDKITMDFSAGQIA